MARAVKSSAPLAAAIPAHGGVVEEMQGLYGPFGFPEKLLQRIWRDREFVEGGAATQDGSRLTVLHPGRWNHLGGPDFKDARLRLGGREVRGDVEVHLRAGDWVAHGHGHDPAYADVVLHVVLFPPPGTWTEGGGGRRIPVFVLLPRLWQGLEEYAAEAAVAALADRPAVEPWAPLREVTATELEELIAREARRRWESKVRHARRRIEQLGWDRACHHAALEILGYRFNRAPMLRLAGAWPVARWRRGGANLVADAVEAGAPWHRQGVRPANRPERRLAQYAAWQQARPDWVEVLGEVAAECRVAAPDVAAGVGAARRQAGWGARRRAWRECLTGGAVGGVRFDHLLHDGFLPLLAAAGRIEEKEALAWWWIGQPGDLPDFVTKGLRVLGVGGVPGRPLATGPAQGLLGWCLRREEQAATGGKLDNKTD
jgi:hypothetical protein